MPEVETAPVPLTRETFISPDYVKIAAAQPTMFVLSEDGKRSEPAPMLDSIKETGVIPEGFVVDFILDPEVVVKSLEENGITTLGQLGEDKLSQIMAVVNAGENLAIVPTSVYEEKRGFVEETLAKETKEVKKDT